MLPWCWLIISGLSPCRSDADWGWVGRAQCPLPPMATGAPTERVLAGKQGILIGFWPTLQKPWRLPVICPMIWIKAFRFLDQDNGSVPLRRNEPPTPQMRDG